MRIRSVFIIAVTTLVFSTCKEQKKVTKTPEIKDYKNLSFKPLSKDKMDSFYSNTLNEQVLVEDGYYVWGVSVVKWEGEFHAYYSRWNKKYEHKGWMTNCEIAHAVSDKPEGPFKFVNIVLKDKKVGGWDINNSHNPYAIVANGKICLYYIANDVKTLLKEDGANMGYPDDAWFDDNRMRIRDRQCIGVAVSKAPSGPFVRSKNVVVKPDNVKFKSIAVNPAVVYHKNKYLMIMKGDDVKRKERFRIQLIGVSDNPEGEFNFKSKPVFAEVQTEDACMWFDQVMNKYYMVCHVMGKSELALFNSEDGVDWKADERKTFMKKEFVLENGDIWEPKRVERPFVLTNKKGQPIMLYVAVYDKDVNGNIAIPIENNLTAN